MKWLLFATIAATGTPAAADCELHVWPAYGTGANTGGWLSNLGPAGAAADYERNKDVNLRDQAALILALPPGAQAQALSEADLPAILGMAGAKITFESRPLDARSIGRDRRRRTASKATCYAELIVALNFYRRSAVYGRQLTSHFAFKDYRSGATEAKIVGGKETHAVPLFPPESTAMEAQSHEQLAAAFVANVTEFARKIGKRKQAPH